MMTLAWRGAVSIVAALAFAAPAQAADPAFVAKGRLLFQKDAPPPCATCHTLKDAGSSGTLGPNLDELKPSRERVMAALRDGVGVMPEFADKLSAEQVKTLADYVVWATQPR